MRIDFQRPFALGAGATELLLVRHGATARPDPERPFRLVGEQNDPPLGRRGEAQAAAVATLLGPSPAAPLFVTTLQRTVQTAAPLAGWWGVVPEVVAELREVALGEWEAGGEFGRRVLAGDPVWREAWARERWDVIPGAEAQRAFRARVAAGLRRVADAVGPGARGVAIVHGAVIGEACRAATLSTPFAFLGAENGSVTRLVRDPDGGWRVRSFNDIGHLCAAGTAPPRVSGRS